jgi:hypothetical protein
VGGPNIGVIRLDIVNVIGLKFKIIILSSLKYMGKEGAFINGQIYICGMRTFIMFLHTIYLAFDSHCMAIAILFVTTTTRIKPSDLFQPD